MRRVPFHQSVFDLLDMEPRESPPAREMIEACEARCGRRLPEAVRQWYLTEGVVPLRHDADWQARARNLWGSLWYDYTMDWPESLEVVVRQFAGEPIEVQESSEGRPVGTVRIMTETQGAFRFYIQLDGSDDPPVVVDERYDFEAKQLGRWVRFADRFSAFVFDGFAQFYSQKWTPLSEYDRDAKRMLRSPADKPYRNGLWLYAPDAEPLAPPPLDFLIEQFEEGYRRQLAGGAMQYGFSHADGTIRVTTDDPGEEGGVAAWWLHADSAEHLYRLAERVLWCGDLRGALRHHTKAAGMVMGRFRGRG
jgi:hypothetical protein